MQFTLLITRHVTISYLGPKYSYLFNHSMTTTQAMFTTQISMTTFYWEIVINKVSHKVVVMYLLL